jgi:predicted DNA-binding transcriptional regulator AlpA
MKTEQKKSETPPPWSQVQTDPKKLQVLLSWSQVRPLIGNQGRTTWWRAIRRGEAPAPVQVSPGRVAWRESDICAWQAQVAQAADGVAE